MAWVVVDLAFGVAHAATGRCSRQSTERDLRSQSLIFGWGLSYPVARKPKISEVKCIFDVAIFSAQNG